MATCRPLGRWFLKQINNIMKTSPNEPITPVLNVPVLVDDNEELIITKDPSKYHLVTNFEGLTKREYFAAMALQGLITNCFYGSGVPDKTHAEKAVQLADALIEALNK